MKTIFYTATFKKAAIFLFAVTMATAINAQTFRIFNPATEGPSGGAAGPEANLNFGGAIVTGLKFRVTQGGTISAIHFYKGTSNTQANTVTLWTLAGANLGSAVLPADAVSGWRTVTLGTPVNVGSGTTYVVSVHNATGNFAGTSGGIPNTDVARPGFIIIGGTSSAADPANPGNGVYDFTASTTVQPTTVDPGLFNFWVDVNFTTFFPLPARLSEFNATVSNRNNVELVWKTESEQNNKGFEIQRSNNGSDWYAIGFINGAGESSTTRSYNYTDKTLAPGIYYYRLEQKDFDGGSSKSSVVTATIGGRGTVSLTTGLNPFRTSTNIRFDLPSKQKVRLSVIDLNGREVRVLADNVREPGTNQVTLSADGLSRQMYYIRLQTETETVVKKVIVQ
jgi:hypothetical protein